MWFFSISSCLDDFCTYNLAKHIHTHTYNPEAFSAAHIFIAQYIMHKLSKTKLENPQKVSKA